MSITEKNIKEIISKLNLLVRLLAASIIEGKSATEQIKLLDQAGLQPKDIADIIGKTSNYVRVTLSSLRKAHKRGKKGNE